MKRVIIESPYTGNIELNEIYGELCMRDCLVNYNESPYASHLLYTRKYVLKDSQPEERKLGIEAGFYWREIAEKTVIYTDLGLTEGMKLGMWDCVEKGRPHEIRNLPKDLWDKVCDICLKSVWGNPMIQEETKNEIAVKIQYERMDTWLKKVKEKT